MEIPLEESESTPAPGMHAPAQPQQSPQKVHEPMPESMKEAIKLVLGEHALGQSKKIKKEYDKKNVPDALTWSELISAFNRYQNPDARFCFAWLYMTGQRIAEATRTYARHIKIQPLDGKDFMVVDTHTVKNKQTKHRTLGIPMGGREADFMKLIWSRLEKMSPDARVIPVTPAAVWHRLRKVTVMVRSIDSETFEHNEPSPLRIYPHYLRHCRASHLAMDYKYDHQRLMKWFGWSSPNMPDYYITGSWTWLADGFKERN